LPPEFTAVLRGLELLPPLIEQSLSLLGVTVERRVGVLVDATRHRVVETRGEEDRPRVCEVIRPGYWIGNVCVREADVVASKPRKNKT
jgi:molecular chaperone GrpE (heat shock protein)